jgi:peptidoglycan/xylan/chitin deacetylase (PgdA/CDA1 family)
MNWNLGKFGAQMIIRTGLLPAIERLESQRGNRLRILAYHRLGFPGAEANGLDPTLISATPAVFAQQMHYLVDNYHVVSMDHVLSALQSGRTLPPRSVMITFDDGYRGFLNTAWPILRSLDIPATLFVATGYLSGEGRMFWWDQLYQAFCQTNCQEFSLPSLAAWPLHSTAQRTRAFMEVKQVVRNMEHNDAASLVEKILKNLGVSPAANEALLSWHDLRALAAHGLCIGAHTRWHPILSRITLEEAREEIIGGQEDLDRELEQTRPIFAYPSGHPTDLGPGLVQLLQEAGFRLAVTLIEGHNTLGRTNPLRLKRVCLAPHLTMAEFRLALTGVFNIYGYLVSLQSRMQPAREPREST